MSSFKIIIFPRFYLPVYVNVLQIFSIECQSGSNTTSYREVSSSLIAVLCLCWARLRRRKSQQAEREYEKVKHQLENLEESVRDRCKKEFTGTVSAAVQKAGDVANVPQMIQVCTKI